MTHNAFPAGAADHQLARPAWATAMIGGAGNTIYKASAFEGGEDRGDAEQKSSLSFESENLISVASAKALPKRGQIFQSI
jgi:hypothetical protein